MEKRSKQEGKKIKNKKILIGIAIVLLVCFAVAGAKGLQQKSIEQENAQIEAELEAKKNAEAEIKLEEERLAQLAAEEEALKIAEEEKAREAEEERIRLEAERDAELIEENTYFVAKDNAKIYDSITLVEGADGEESIELGNETGLLENKSSIFVADYSGDYYYVKDSLYGDPLGYVKSDNLVKDRTELMYMTYDDVDYTKFEKTEGYESNPMLEVKGIFLTAYRAVADIDYFIEVLNETELNAIVIDVKDDSGDLLFDFEGREDFGVENVNIHTDDIATIVEKCKENDIYLIARIVAFKSPKYARTFPERAIVYSGTNTVYSYGDGTSWASAFDRDLWDYNIAVAKAAADAGFNEIQYDYVRFPDISTSKRSSLDYRNTLDESYTAAIQNFLKESYEELSPYEVYIAADVFGWVATAVNDQGIGQHWEAISAVVDYMCPMVYPSHYGSGIFGYDVPDANPYGTVYNSVNDAIQRDKNIESPALLRPWIQDFNAPWVSGYINYGPFEIKEQIRALNDLGINDFILWGAGSRFTFDAFY